ncbi:hypothetical protein SODALDRAFT_361077 [Sodiomyces alkalinus F11]|uniref:Uncharacterized protein n=1 Tax=Sodiomyces alkalinus (strain CBS 110278 / VKM F-3762 / F11) TaxID=1314773 RepID=A0A3N2PS77_SODAK|nr:hypothetical protein SODALDRAFT_361077 [Sodiomyces alkalinus F11]ROT37371.1 hypothetical protein SODALDRAFT_361077 [Sodiomyces alkalinus F11]
MRQPDWLVVGTDHRRNIRTASAQLDEPELNQPAHSHLTNMTVLSWIGSPRAGRAVDGSRMMPDHSNSCPPCICICICIQHPLSGLGSSNCPPLRTRVPTMNGITSYAKADFGLGRYTGPVYVYSRRKVFHLLVFWEFPHLEPLDISQGILYFW